MSFAKWTLAVALLGCSVPGEASAQAVVQTAPLHGVVVDASGAPVANANVVVLRDGIEVSRTATDAQGSFSFVGTPREYRVEVQGPPGFRVLKSSSIPFTVDGTTRFTLEVAPTDMAVSAAVQGALRDGPVRQEASKAPWEFGALLQGGLGLTENRGGFKFLSAGAHFGKVLTPELGPGLFRGNFEYAGELFPYWGAYTPTLQRVFCDADPGAPPGSYTCSNEYTVGGTYTGVSVTPIILRWNFTHGQHWMPWVQGAGGLVWTNHKFPAVGNTNPSDLSSNGIHGDTSVWNFTPQFGIGTHYFVRPHRSLDFSANAVHISSSSLGDRNPGVNASVQFTVGYTWWR